MRAWSRVLSASHLSLCYFSTNWHKSHVFNGTADPLLAEKKGKECFVLLKKI